MNCQKHPILWNLILEVLYRVIGCDEVIDALVMSYGVTWLEVQRALWKIYEFHIKTSWRTVVISGTVHWLYLKTSFHPLLWTSSGLTGSWKLSAYIRFGSLRSVKVLKKPEKVLKVLNLMVIRCLRSLKVLNLIARKMWEVLVVGLRSGRC